MEFPPGHHSRPHHHRSNDDEEERRDHYRPPDTTPPPPSFHQPPPPSSHYYQEPPQPPSFHQPPPPSSHYYQEPPQPPRPYFQEATYAPSPPPPFQETQVIRTSHNYPPPPPPTQVNHVSHEKTETHQSFKPHMPSFIHQQTHQSGSASGLDLYNKPSFKVYSKAEPDFHLTIRDGRVILARSNPSDEFQNWFKDEKFSTRVKDSEGCPAFALVNKATGQAIKHSIGEANPVQLIPYNPDVLDESILWTQSKDMGDGFRAVITNYGRSFQLSTEIMCDGVAISGSYIVFAEP
uniref:Uncharacterized protein n=1 Tax=Populus alba TaxID=43335 RepID=A0A4U5R5C2_POPAL|nr:hypothetical protein D5086_0000004660 [Populus alba]